MKKTRKRYAIIFAIFILILSWEATPARQLKHLHLEIPVCPEGAQIIRHSAYTFRYEEKYEQAVWIAYKLTAQQINGSFKRKNNFRIDPSVKTGSASPQDYKKSGYDRGHLAPAADMKQSETSMSESFFMSNMSPQKPGFNRGIWKRLEEQIRKWALARGGLYIVTAGILQGNMKKIGKNNVAVPNYFYKVILDYKKSEVNGIAFILPNKKSNRCLKDFIVTIDRVEKITGIDFFPALPDNIEKKIEASVDQKKWKLTVKKKKKKQPVRRKKCQKKNRI